MEGLAYPRCPFTTCARFDREKIAKIDSCSGKRPWYLHFTTRVYRGIDGLFLRRQRQHRSVLKSYLRNSRVQRSTGNDGVSKDSCDCVLDSGQGRVAQLRYSFREDVTNRALPSSPVVPVNGQCHEDDNCYARLRESADNRESMHVQTTSSRSAAYKSATPREAKHQSTIFESTSSTKPSFTYSTTAADMKCIAVSRSRSLYSFQSRY